MRPRRGRWLAIAVAVTTLALTSCGQASSLNNERGDLGRGTHVGLALDTGGLPDKAINDLANAGLYRAQDRLGVSSEIATPNLSGTDRADVLNSLVENKTDPVIAVDDGYADALAKLSDQKSSTRFVIVDSEAVRGPNISNLMFATEQGSYLMGVAAARKSINGKIGFIGAASTERVNRYRAGFEAGARSIKPNIKIEAAYLSQNTGDRDGNNVPTMANQVATQMLDKGVEVIYHASGSSGSGIFDAVVAARKHGKKNIWAIGSDSNQYLTATEEQKKVILTSMVKQVDNAVFSYIKDRVSGKDSVGTRQYSLQEKGVDYALSGGYIEEVKPELEKIKKQIIAGKILVPAII